MRGDVTIRAGVTIIDSFRRMLTADTLAEDRLIKDIMKKPEPNDKMKIGSAFHRMTETIGTEDEWLDWGQTLLFDSEKNVNTYTIQDVKFNEKHYEIARAYKKKLKGSFHEHEIKKFFSTKNGSLLVTGICDVIHGKTIRDIKCRFVPMTPGAVEQYTDSYQWRLYTDIAGLDRFCYDVFEFKGYKPENGLDVSDCAIVRQEPIECLWYYNKRQDITKLLDDFTDWMKFRNLESYFELPVGYVGYEDLFL